MFIRDTLITKKVVRHDEITHNCCALIENVTNDDEDEIQELLVNEIRDVDTDEESNNDPIITDNDPNAHLCPICLDPFKVDERVSWSRHLIACKHVYHANCISAWLACGNKDCPCCRRNYFSPRMGNAIYCFGSNNDNARNKDAGEECKVINILSEGQFCVDHGLCLSTTELAVEELCASSTKEEDCVETGHDEDSDLKSNH